MSKKRIVVVKPWEKIKATLDDRGNTVNGAHFNAFSMKKYCGQRIEVEEIEESYFTCNYDYKYIHLTSHRYYLEDWIYTENVIGGKLL